MAMAAATLFLLLMAAFESGGAQFFGDSVNVRVVAREGGAFQMAIQHRQNGRSNCTNNNNFTCESGSCSEFTASPAQQGDASAAGGWCQSEAHLTADIQSGTKRIDLRNSGCCWTSNVEGARDWSSSLRLDLGVRSDTRALNNCPVTTSVSSLRVPENCFSQIRLLAHDPDGDRVRCTFINSTGPEILLDTSHCTITKNQNLSVGVHVLEVKLEDLPTRNITLTYHDGTSVAMDTTGGDSLCSVTLQFTLEILPSVANCKLGDGTPIFLSKTPSHGDVLHASVGQPFRMEVQAEAQSDSIHDFQVSGPQNMSKEVHSGRRAEMTLSWTPQESDLRTVNAVCFTAEASQSQSDMRCAVIMVSRSTISQGTGGVTCAAEQMTVFLEKASIPGIDVRYLQLKDPSCKLTSNSTHIMGTISFRACGTELEDQGDYMVFKNQIKSFELAKEVIIRRKTVEIDFACQFPKSAVVTNFYTLRNSDYIFSESSFGSFGYSFNVFKDGNFTDRYESSSYPVEKQLMQPIYMGIAAESELPNLELFVESCRATPDDNPENPMFYDLIKDGCFQDETVKVYPSDQMSFHFDFLMFKFTGNYDMVYVRCLVLLCDSQSSSSRCTQGCLQEPSRRRKRSAGGETNGHYITQGPFQLVEQGQPDGAKKAADLDAATTDGVPPSDAWPTTPVPPVSQERRVWEEDAREVLRSDVSTVMFAGTFLASVLLLVVVVVQCVRRRSPEDRKALLKEYM
ncbi:uncharacterized protein ACB058_003375 [Synchiropus picturatus]